MPRLNGPVDFSRLAEQRGGWLGSANTDPGLNPPERDCTRCGASEPEYRTLGCPDPGCAMRRTA